MLQQEQSFDERIELQVQLRELLPRLHEFDYVERHPLTIRLIASLPASNEAISPRVRDVLIETIQQLKPADNVERQAAQWRQYTILQDRYILRRSLRDIEDDLAVGERQMRREHQQAIASLAALLTPLLKQGKAQPDANASKATALADAVQRLSPLPRVFGVNQLLNDIAWAVDHALLKIPHAARPQLEISVVPPDLSTYTDRGILHQLLLKLTQLVIYSWDEPEEPGVLRLAGMPCVERTPAKVNVELSAPGHLSLPDDDDTMRLCMLLAGLLHSSLHISRAEDRLAIALQIPAGERLHKVLIIDDELPAVELFQGYLIGLQYETFVEVRPERALDRARLIAPDVIVLDVMMPGMDGWELLQRLRHTPALADVPIIACSVIDDAELAAALGASKFLRKPVLRSHLIESLKQVLAA